MTERKVFARGEKKLTQKELFTEILDKVQDDELLTEFVEYQIELLNRKSATRGTKKESEENIALKEKVLSVMGENYMTVSDVVKALAESGTIYSPQKITSLMGKLIADGKVHKTIEKRVSYFSKVVG